jgi:hypothetical protein
MTSTNPLMKCLLKARADIADTYELDPEILESIHQIVVKACEPILKAKPAKAEKEAKAEKPAKEKTARPKSAYNMFVKAKFSAAKADGGNNSQDIMSTVSGQWAKLSEEEKQVYVKLAEEANANLPESPAPASKGKHAASGEEGSEPKRKKRTITGYNVFYRENKDKFKAAAPAPSTEGGGAEPTAAPESTMTACGKAWKALSKEEQEEWNARAKKEVEAAGEGAASETVATV